MGYDGCEALTGPEYEDVFYKQNWASNVKMVSYYMFYGCVSFPATLCSRLSRYSIISGTNWGGIGHPGVYTRYAKRLQGYISALTFQNSYDYGGAIRESRTLSPKFDEMKRQGLFLRSSPDFRKTDWIADSSSGFPGIFTDNPAAFVTFLQNPDTGAGFYIVRQNDSTST